MATLALGVACASPPSQIALVDSPVTADRSSDRATGRPASSPPAEQIVRLDDPLDVAGDPSATPVLSEELADRLAALDTPAVRIVPDGVRRLRLGFTGDTLMHSPLWDQARRNAAAGGREGYDFTPMMRGLLPVLGGTDLAICHLETPIAPLGEPYSTAPLYGAPAEIVEALVASGHRRCSTASNHTLDRGVTGIARTIEVLESWGITQHGMARTPAEIEPSVLEVNGVRLAHMSYTFSYNGLRTPADEPWRSALIDPARIVADAARARELGAEVVIVSMHWGAEGSHQITSLQRSQAEQITASGLVDLIVGHHAHVVQPIELVNGVPVAFGLGNIISNLREFGDWPAATQDAAVLVTDLRLDPDGTVVVERIVIHPTWVDRDGGWVVRLVLDDLADPGLGPGRRRVLEQSLMRTERVLGDWFP